jgi:hypothetical protein
MFVFYNLATLAWQHLLPFLYLSLGERLIFNVTPPPSLSFSLFLSLFLPYPSGRRRESSIDQSQIRLRLKTSGSGNSSGAPGGRGGFFKYCAMALENMSMLEERNF